MTRRFDNKTVAAFTLEVSHGGELVGVFQVVHCWMDLFQNGFNFFCDKECMLHLGEAVED